MKRPSLFDLSLGALAFLAVLTLGLNLRQDVPLARLLAQSDDPRPPRNPDYCFKSNGFIGSCSEIGAGQACVPDPLMPIAAKFTDSEDNAGDCFNRLRKQTTSARNQASQQFSAAQSSAQSPSAQSSRSNSRASASFASAQASSSASSQGYCGDGVVQPGEQCDRSVDSQGNTFSPTRFAWDEDPNCTSTCTFRIHDDLLKPTLFFVFRSVVDSALFFVRPIIDWGTIFPLKAVTF